MKKVIYNVILIICCFLLVACNGWRSKKPPIHLNPNMDFQPKNTAQSDSLKFPSNVVPWGNEESLVNPVERNDYLQENPVIYVGKDSSGQWVEKIPVQVNHKLINRGQNRYNIYCTPCHGLDGSGNAAVTQRGWMKPAPYWDDRIVNYTDGKLYDIVKNGIRSMPGYKQQLNVSDRWAIVSYIRALQKTKLTKIQDVPAEIRNDIME